MSDVAINYNLPDAEVFYKPEELEISPKYDMRPWSSAHQTEDKTIEKLADSIEELGQLDDVLIALEQRKGKKGEEGKEVPVILAGQRRRRAIQLVNQRRNGQATSMLPVRCRVVKDPEKAWKAAWASNKEREQMTPMDIAMKIHSMREEYGTDLKGTGKIGRQLGLDKASVHQYEKFVVDKAFTKVLQGKLHEGTISMQSAFDIVAAKITDPSEQEEVIKKAKKHQDDAAVEKITDDETLSTDEKKTQVKKAKEKKRVESPAIRKAIKEKRPDAKTKYSKSQARKFFAELDGPAYGFVNGPVRQFISYFVQLLGEGVGDEEELLKKWDKLVSYAPTGEKTKEDDAPPVKVKKARVEKVRVEKAPKKEKAKEAKPAKDKKSKAAKKPKPVKQKRLGKKAARDAERVNKKLESKKAKATAMKKPAAKPPKPKAKAAKKAATKKPIKRAAEKPTEKPVEPESK
jgi:hypothetical protein